MAVGINLKYLMRRVQGNKVKSNPRKYFFTEEQIAEAYKKHDGNYGAMAKELIGKDGKSGRLLQSIKNEPWANKYPRRSSTRKYFITEEELAASYKKHDGNYGDMGRELLPVGAINPGTLLYNTIKNQSWAHKYPPKGSNRKYFFTEEQIAEAYKKHDGNYSSMGKELLDDGSDQPGSRLYDSIRNQPWAHKYPRIGTSRKYFFTEEQIAESYKKHDGNYKAMGRELIPEALQISDLLLLQAIKNQPWAHKYPRKKRRKYFLSEGEVAAAYKKYEGNYGAMGRALLPVGTKSPGVTLFGSIQNQPWAHKYPRRKNKAIGDKKSFNRGQYQNAVTNALASKIGMDVPQVYRDDEEINKDAEMLLKDINDLSNEGMSVDEIAEELNIEKAIVRRALEVKVKSNPRKYFFTEEQIAEAYKKHDGNYRAMARELLPVGVINPGGALYQSIKYESWVHKYPPKGSPKKYFFTEEQIAEAYEKHDGNYDAMARELIPANIISPGKTLVYSIKNQPWAYKYPAKGSTRKYFFTEDQIAEAYKKHDGNYQEMARELIPVKIEKSGGILYSSIKNQPWAYKYPPKGSGSKSRRYFFTEEQIAEAYKKYDGNYTHMARELLPANIKKPGGILYKSIQKQPWAHKYPPQKRRKYFLTEGEVAAAYKRFEGNYAAMGKSLLPVGTQNPGETLYGTIKNQPWAHKYPRRKKEALGYKKSFNRGQYQNAVTNALASKIGMEVPQVYRDDEEINKDAEMLLKDINDLSNEGLSVDEIAEELNIEKAIVKRALEVKVKPNPVRRSNPEPQFLRAYVNSIAEALWIYCFDFYEAVKLKRPISSVNNSAYLNFYYFVAVMNTDLAYFTMFYTCKMLSNIDFELSLLNNDMRPFNMNIIKALANKSEMESPFATKISIKIIDLMDYDSLESDERERVSDYFKQQIKNEILHDIFVYFVMITTVKDVTPMVNEARNLIKEIFTNYEITVNKKEDVSKHTEDIILLLGCFRYLFAVDKMKFSINKKLSEKTRLDLARTFGGHINIFVAKNIIDSVIYFQNSLDKEINEMLPPVKPNPSKKHRRYQ